MTRSKWKGPYIKLTEKLQKYNIILPRNYTITSILVGKNINIHDGRKFITVNITNDMIGHKLGEFVLTREIFVFKKKKKKK